MVYSLLTIDHQLLTEYIMKCPYCNSKIAEWYVYCGECGVNIADFSQGLQLLKEGKELEEEFDYTKAGQKYKESLELKIPKEEIRDSLERLMSKQTRIIENIDKGKEYMTQKAYNRAVLSFKEVISLIPDDEDIIVRKRAVKSLGKIDAPDIIPILRGALFDKSKRVRISAAEALALRGDTSGINFLKNILKE